LKRISIYVEGGGDTVAQRLVLRQGFDTLLMVQKNKAADHGVGWKLVCEGGRQLAYESFMDAVDSSPDAINILLVDSEVGLPPVPGLAAKDAPVRTRHLATRDGWRLSGVPPEQVHLMVQTMEAWILADPEALAAYYGKGFRTKALPVRENLEEEPKDGLVPKLDKAVNDTAKRRYRKIEHAGALLKMIDPSKVALRCPRFKLFLDWLEETIEGT
jgi:hypothetical protein